MGLFTDINTINQIGLYVERFRWVEPSKVANCRCPVCGDSQKNKRKARGYFFIHKEKFRYRCHKCGYSESLWNFIQHNYPAMLDQYRLDSFKEDKTTSIPTAPTKDQQKEFVEVRLDSMSIDNLPEAHQGVQYVIGRKIPRDRWDDIGYTENFAKTVSEVSGDRKYFRLPKDPRIILELRDENGKLFGIQGRALKSSPMRYITIRFDDSQPKLFGMDSVNRSQPIFVTEGPFDSLFLPNSIALCGGDVSQSLQRYSGCDVTVVLDNEPYSKDTVSRMRAAIDRGFKVAFWKIDPKFKDINDMVVKGGFSPEFILNHIKENSFKGGYALATLLMWKKN